MTIYHINYTKKNTPSKMEITFEINSKKIKLWFIPIIKDSEKYTWDFLNEKQIEQLDNLMYKKPDSCFYDEIKSYDSIIINDLTLSSNYPVKTTGNLFILDNNNNIIGYLSYRYIDNHVFIENVCINKAYRGIGVFKVIFNWFLEKTNNLYQGLNFQGFKLTVWKESPFNKKNEIVEIYKKFGFKFLNEEKYSSKRTYIHMNKN